MSPRAARTHSDDDLRAALEVMKRFRNKHGIVDATVARLRRECGYQEHHSPFFNGLLARLVERGCVERYELKAAGSPGTLGPPVAYYVMLRYRL